MDFHTLLRLLHITSFAAWFGTVLASLFLLKTLETSLTGKPDEAARDSVLLRSYIKLETRVADIAFIGVIITGILLASLYHGWGVWVFVKSGTDHPAGSPYHGLYRAVHPAARLSMLA